VSRLSTLIAALVFSGPAFADWQLQCSHEKCRAFTYTDQDIALRRIRFFVEFSDRAEFVISPLITRDQHQRDFTSNPPTVETFGDQEYVLEPNFFGRKLRARVRVDSQLIGTARIGAKGLLALRPADVYRLTDAVKRGRELEVEYAAEGERYALPLSFDLTGLANELAKFPKRYVGELGAWPGTKPPFVEADEVEPVALLVKVGNRHSVQSSQLWSVANPRGSGSFVYVKDREGFIWFVKDGDVVAVSGWANNVTPDALDRYEVHAEFWRGTGVDADSVFRVGANLAQQTLARP
jgi:hypothetical protein